MADDYEFTGDEIDRVASASAAASNCPGAGAAQTLAEASGRHIIADALAPLFSAPVNPKTAT